MLADSRVIYLFVYVSDLQLSRAFYQEKLGLRVIEEDPDCVKFDCGQVILALNRAADFNIPLPKTKDTTTEVVFMVENMAETRAALESRGVELLPTSDDEPGKIANFYDPDGHWFALYEPSEEALSWPTGPRLRALMRARQNGNGAGAARISSDSSAKSVNGLKGLDGSDLLYTFLFVRDTVDTQTFYHDDLGLRDIEGGPCTQSSEHSDQEGVVKYDAGLLLSTHLTPRALTEGYLKSVAPVFYVKNVEHAVKTLSRRRASLTPKVMRSGIGVVASLEDPTGHQLYLYEPSEEAMSTPSGQKIREILAMQF
jgi:catechol 2,3-dioxygenase-like lactoylglutathione lyase family enzyme